MMESHSELRPVIRLNFSLLHLAFMSRWDVNCNSAEIFFSSACRAVCLHTHLSPCASRWSFLVLHIQGEHHNYENFPFDNLLA